MGSKQGHNHLCKKEKVDKGKTNCQVASGHSYFVYLDPGPLSCHTHLPPEVQVKINFPFLCLLTCCHFLCLLVASVFLTIDLQCPSQVLVFSLVNCPKSWYFVSTSAVTLLAFRPASISPWSLQYSTMLREAFRAQAGQFSCSL